MSKKQELMNSIQSKKIIVWGARMTGIGFTLFLKSIGHNEVVGFVDSDSSLHNKQINNIPIFSPKKLTQLKKENPSLIIVIAVALKEDDIIKDILKMGFNNDDYIIYSKFCTDFYTVDVVGSCNLKCPSCAHGASGMESPMGLMPLETFKKVIDKALIESEVVSHMSLYSWGEPLLHKDLDTMINYLHEKGIAVAISSNLSIRSTEQIEKLIKASPDYLKISLSGFYPQTYNDTHTGGDIRLVKSNLYRIRYLIDKFNASTLVDVNYHLYNNNCGENLKKMEELCDELGFTLSKAYSLVMPLERVIEHCEGNTSQEVKILDNKLLVTIDEGIEASKVKEYSKCPFRENQVNINWDLSVPVCCTVYNRNQDTIVAKNYLDVSLKDINTRKQKVDICNKCLGLNLPAYNMGFNRNIWENIANTKICKDTGK